MCQALTQRPPARSGERGEVVALPTDVPVSFIDIVRRCLARNPAQRPSVADLQAWLKPGARVPTLATPAPPGVGDFADTKLPAGKTLGAAAVGTKVTGAKAPGAKAADTRSADADTPTRLRIRAVLNSEPVVEASPERKSTALPIWGAVAALALVGVGVYWFMGRSSSEAPGTESAAPTVAGQPAVTPPSDSSTPSSSEPPAAALSAPDRARSNHAAPPSADSNNHPPAGRAPESRPSATDADTEEGPSPGVLHQEIPNVSSRSRQTIHGRVRVSVRVTVDKSGTVTGDVLENPGPSKYFARVAGEAASKWKFVPADGQATRQWLIRFEFSRDGVKAHAVTRN
ncbi:MAG TPA: TonB family protein [Steroidobacteraceae bacterium]